MTDFEVVRAGRFGELPTPSAKPLTIVVHRGPLIESRHDVICALVEPDGRVIAGWGDIDQPVYPRSAIKSLQALPLVESGAAASCNASDAELALACASHGGEPRHAATAAGWLGRVGLGVGDLECGAHWPYHEASARVMFAAGEQPTAAHNNCSGKHSGFLATAKFLGEATAGYVKPDHPVQRRVRATLAEMCGVDLTDAATGVDGCSIPTVAVPLKALARGMARFAAPDGLDFDRAAACRRLQTAIAAEPFMIAGTGRFCTAAISETGGRALVKTGAEGVFCAALPEFGLGVALKALDGSTRAAELTMAAVLDRLDLLDRNAATALERVMKVPMVNWNGITVGGMMVANGEV